MRSTAGIAAASGTGRSAGAVGRLIAAGQVFLMNRRSPPRTCVMRIVAMAPIAGCGRIGARAAGTAAPASRAVPRQDISSTPRAALAAVSSNARPRLAASTGKALMAIGMASTAYADVNSCQPEAEWIA